MRFLLGLLLVLAVSAIPQLGSAQALLRRYVARQDARAYSVARTAERRAVRRMQTRVTADGHSSERHVVRPLGRSLFAVYTRSQIDRRQLDRFRVFRADRSGRAREVSLTRAYRAAARHTSYDELVGLWQETVGQVLSSAYERDAAVRVQVDTELRFLEGEITRRVSRSTTLAFPWTQRTAAPVAALEHVGDPATIDRALRGARRPGEGSRDMLRRGTYRVYDTHELPRREFHQLLRDGRTSRPQAYRDLRTRDHARLRRSNSALARRLNEDMYGYQFADQRSAMVQNQPSEPQSTAETIVHELNHGANRVPRRASYSERETLAFELTAAAAEARAAGRPLRVRDLRRLKQRLIADYQLSNVDVDSVADRPHGHTDNWVPQFPRGQEGRYTDAYFRVSR